MGERKRERKVCLWGRCAAIIKRTAIRISKLKVMTTNGINIPANARDKSQRFFAFGANGLLANVCAIVIMFDFSINAKT